MKRLFKLYLLGFLISPFINTAFSLNERFEVYNSTQSLGMGNAVTADAFGFAALYHNPSGLALFKRKNIELTPVDIQGGGGLTGIGRASAAQTLGEYRLFGPMKQNPGSYVAFNYASVPAFTIRGFGLSFLGSYQYAALSDGTTIDIDTRQDLGMVMGYGRYFAGNVIRVGIAAKGLIRNQMKGQYAHSSLDGLDDDGLASLHKEGFGVGVDFGMAITLPVKYLPTLAFAWKDMFDTRFLNQTTILNKQARGVPDALPQSFNTGFSIHPYLSNKLKQTWSVEWKHWEIQNWSWKKHLHVGFQLEDERTFYLWLGLNQMHPGGGVGYRVKGGTLEIGTYGQEIAADPDTKNDQRLFFRYTIGF